METLKLNQAIISKSKKSLLILLLLVILFGLPTITKASINRPNFPLFLDAYSYANGSNNGTPSGLANWANGEGSTTVTGIAGLATLNINSVNVGVISDYALGTEPWAIVIMGDDGIYRVYSVYAVDTGAMTFSVSPSLVSSVTSQVAGNLYDSYHGQHLTTLGYYGLADSLVRQTKEYSYMQKYVGRYVSDGAGTRSGSPWVAIGGLVNGGYVPPTGCMYKGVAIGTYNMGNYQCYPYPESYIYGNVYMTYIGAAVTGQGAKQTVNLRGKSGYLDTYLAIDSQQDINTTASARVKVYIDGSLVLNTTFGAFQHIQVPYTHANSGEIEVTVDSNYPARIRISNTTWYVWNDLDWNGVNPSDLLIPNGSKIVLLEDSWGVFHNNAFQSRLQANLPASTITNVSVSGTQATWGTANYSTLVAPLNPDYVISDFQINDINAGVTYPQLLTNLQSLWNLALQNGATPIYLRSLPTASISQMQNINKWDQTLVSNYPINFDYTLPSILLTTPATPITSSSTVTLAATATDDVGVAGVTFYRDSTIIDSEVVATSSPDTYSLNWDTTSVVDGTYNITAVSRDTSNNYSATSSGVTITVDNYGPTGTISNGNGTPTNSTTPTFNLTIADSGVGITGAQMQFSCDNITWSTWENYATPKTNFNVRTSEGCTDADGSKTVYVKYKDSLGNIGSAYNTTAFTLDTVSSSSRALATITVVAAVVNDNGGTKSVADFPLFINGTSVVSGVTNTFLAPALMYTVTETTDPRYTRTFSVDCTVDGTLNLNPGDQETCIVTNDDIALPAVVSSSGSSTGTVVLIAATGSFTVATSTTIFTQATSIDRQILIARLLTQIALLRTQLVALLAETPTPHFTRDLSLHDSGTDVMELQRYLNRNGFIVAETGIGSSGQETTYFGILTYKTLVKFQEAHASDILIPNGLKKGTGYFGSSTRTFVNK